MAGSWERIVLWPQSPVRGDILVAPGVSAGFRPIPEGDSHRWNRDALDLLDSQAWEALDLQPQWSSELRTGDQAGEELLLRRATYSGRPLGDRDFLRQLEAQLRRRLWTAGPGRPKNEQARTGGRQGA